MTNQVPSPFTQSNIIAAFEELFQDNKDALDVFKDFRHKMLFVAPENKMVVFWNGHMDALIPWVGLCGILGRYAGERDDVAELYDAIIKHYNTRKSELGNNKGFEKGKLLVLNNSVKTSIELYNKMEC